MYCNFSKKAKYIKLKLEGGPIETNIVLDALLHSGYNTDATAFYSHKEMQKNPVIYFGIDTESLTILKISKKEYIKKDKGKKINLRTFIDWCDEGDGTILNVDSGVHAPTVSIMKIRKDVVSTFTKLNPNTVVSGDMALHMHKIKKASNTLVFASPNAKVNVPAEWDKVIGERENPTYLYTFKYNTLIIIICLLKPKDKVVSIKNTKYLEVESIMLWKERVCRAFLSIPELLPEVMLHQKDLLNWYKK